MKTSHLLPLAMLGVLATTSAHAAVVTRAFTVTASDFAGGAPVDPVTGTFSFTFDDAAQIIPQTASGLSISGFNLPYDGAALFSYQKGGDFITVSNAFTGLFQTTLGGSGRKFSFTIFNLSTAPSVSSFGYSKDGAIYNSNSVSLSAAGAVPEPASWAMMILGFGLTGGAIRSGRSRPAAYA